VYRGPVTEEFVTWEEWLIPLVVNLTPWPTQDDEASGEKFAVLVLKFSCSDCPKVLERNRQQELCEESVRGAMLQIITLVNERKKHIPPVNFKAEEAMSFPHKVQ
jgi:hypothetical protein